MVVSFPIFYYFFFTTTRVLDQSGRIVGGVVIKIYLNRGVRPHGRSTDLLRKTKPSTLMAIQPAWNCWDFEINEVGIFDSLWRIQKEGSYASSKHPIQINFWWSFHWWHCSRLKLCFFLTEKKSPASIFSLAFIQKIRTQTPQTNNQKWSECWAQVPRVFQPSLTRSYYPFWRPDAGPSQLNQVAHCACRTVFFFPG